MMSGRDELIGGAIRIPLNHTDDERGGLTSIEFDKRIPFTPTRMFVVATVPLSGVRGEHAHRTCHQLLICVSGSLSVLIDDGSERMQEGLDDPSLGLYLPPMLWSAQHGHSRDAIVIVLASHPYDADDYIRTYGQFLAMKRTAASGAA